MSKITKVRVSQLAKDLGVATKDIIARCETEGIPDVKQPQSTISMGLALTIREWFGGGVAVEDAPAQLVASKTTAGKSSEVDQAEVDEPAKKVSAKKLAARPTAPKPTPVVRKAAPKVAAESAAVVDHGAVETEAKPAKKGAISKAPEADEGDQIQVSPTQDAPKAHAVKQAHPTDASPSVAPVAPPKTFLRPGPPAQANVPTRPTDVRPVGPMLQQPIKTSLSGPRVIRVETPDVIPAPRPRFTPGASQGTFRPGPRFGGGGAGVSGGSGAPASGAPTGASARAPDRNKRRVSATDTRGRTCGLEMG